MHLRGKSFMFEATYPNGTTEVLLNVPNFDFNWQLRYVFAEPKLIPKGTRLHLTAHFDNSADNLANPDPTRDVTDGQQTWDEMMEGLYTSVDAGQDVACMALVALSLAAQPKAARGPEVIGELKKLLDLGEQSTPEIVATAKAQYRRLKSSYPQDRRIDYAFGLVLVNQHQCREAIPMLSRYLEGSDGEPSAYCAKIWTQMSLQSFADVLADAKALADRFPRNGRSTVEEKYREAARFLGVAFAYLDVARPDVPDGKLRAEELKRISQRLGQTYAPDFEEGKTVVAQRVVELKSQDRLTNGDGRASKMDRLGAAAKDRAPRAVDKLNSQPNTADGKETSLSTYAPFPYQQEKQRVLNWFDP